MLSAGKVKTDEEILQFMDGRPVVMSWKLDGLTLVLRYENGTLAQQAITRGREGIVGEDVTHTVRVMSNVPRRSARNLWRCARRRRGQLGQLQPAQRNAGRTLCTSRGGLAARRCRKLNAEESRERGVEFYAFDLISNAEMEAKKKQPAGISC